MTFEQAIRQAAADMEAAGLFFGHGTDNALDEACWLASAAIGMSPDFDAGELGRALSVDEQRSISALLGERIETRKPLAYLLGVAWLAGLKFEVNEQVLVPRSPLAELIVDGFEPWLAPQDLRVAADVGTGSGCLAIALARHWPGVRVDALDISTAALSLAERNARTHGVSDRVDCIHSDLLDAVTGRKYDLILANPPYVPTASMRELPAEFSHEPTLGLEAGSDGLDLVRRLLFSVPDLLTGHGILVCEVGEAAAALIELLGHELELVWLEFAHGGDGVFLLDRPACVKAAQLISTGQ